MASFTLVSDIIEGNGKAVRENNLALNHKIALGTLVEVDCDYIDEHGVRMFVVEHQRDCDGSPLYGLSFDRSLIESKFPPGDPIGELMKFRISSGHSDETLIVIK